MKKIIFLLLALCLAMPATTYAELSKKEVKQCEKDAKKRTKELEKEGWKSMSSLPLESAITKHIMAMADKGLQEQQGVSTKTRSKNNGRQLALNSAMTQYSQKMSTDLVGKVMNNLEAGLVPEAEMEQFSGAFLGETQKQIRGELKESYSMIKDLGDGTYEIQIYYLIDPEAATNAGARALEKTIEEQRLSAELAKVIRDSFKN